MFGSFKSDLIKGLLTGARVQLQLNGIAFCGLFFARLYRDMEGFANSDLSLTILPTVEFLRGFQFYYGGLGCLGLLLWAFLDQDRKKRMLGYCLGAALALAATFLACTLVVHLWPTSLSLSEQIRFN